MLLVCKIPSRGDSGVLVSSLFLLLFGHIYSNCKVKQDSLYLLSPRDIQEELFKRKNSTFFRRFRGYGIFIKQVRVAYF